MKKINLHNRYGENTWLEPIHRNEYILHCNTNHMRVGNMVGDWDIFAADFVDPSGGPYIEIGNQILVRGKKVSKIQKFDGNIHIYFEKVTDND